MFDFIHNVSRVASSQKQSDIFAGCSTSQEITDVFAKELAQAISDSQNVQPMIAAPGSCQGAFARMDTSQDGNLSRDEALSALMPVVEDQEIAQRIFGILDPSGTGQVSQDRFNQCLDTVIKVTSFEAHLNIAEMSQTVLTQTSDPVGGFQEAVDGATGNDGISGKKVSNGAAGLGADAFWMKLMDELDRNRGGKGVPGAEEAGAAQISAQASGQAMSLTSQSVTYAEASISVETVAANLGAVFSAVA